MKQTPLSNVSCRACGKTMGFHCIEKSTYRYVAQSVDTGDIGEPIAHESTWHYECANPDCKYRYSAKHLLGMWERAQPKVWKVVVEEVRIMTYTNIRAEDKVQAIARVKQLGLPTDNWIQESLTYTPTREPLEPITPTQEKP